MENYSIFTCKAENSVICTGSSYVSKNIGFLEREGRVEGNNINGNICRMDNRAASQILQIWRNVELRDRIEDIEFYLNSHEKLYHYSIVEYECYVSFLPKERAYREVREIFTDEDSKILNFNVGENARLKIIVNFNLILEDKEQGNINLVGKSTYENVHWIIYGTAIFIGVNLVGIIIAFGDIIVKNSKVKGKLISISGDIILDSNSCIF